MSDSPIAFVCVNVGPKYDMAYVEILRDMVLRNLTKLERPVGWFCITDRPGELPEGVNHIPADPALPGYWQKVRLFSPDMPWDEGQRVIYFDLDVAITGRLEDFVETKGIIRDWHWPMYNSSVMSWDHGEHREVWTHFLPSIMTSPTSPEVAKLLPAGAVNGGDQEWITNIAMLHGALWPTFPPAWFISYRDAKAWPPAESKAVIFHGKTKPADVDKGWVPNVWKLGGFTSLPQIDGANTTHDFRMDNVRSAVQREHLEWFTGFGDEGSTCVLVGGAPSVKDRFDEIRWHARQKKTRIVTVNNAWRMLLAQGIKPDAVVLLDARAENVEFVTGAPPGMRWLVCSQCHPTVFDVLEAQGQQVVVWHSSHNDNDELMEILQPWWDPGPRQKPTVLVPGGSTVMLRSMWLAAFSGFRRIHMYGIDSSYDVDGAHHAYAQSLNDGETVVSVVRGEKTYQAALWMTRQAAEFEQTWHDLKNYIDPFDKPAPVTVFVHGRGLIPDIAADLKRQERMK